MFYTQSIFSSPHFIECFHMTSRRPYWCPKTMKRRPCWCPKLVLWELNSFLMQTLSFVPINLHRCCPREWKHSIVRSPQSAVHLLYWPIMHQALPLWGRECAVVNKWCQGHAQYIKKVQVSCFCFSHLAWGLSIVELPDLVRGCMRLVLRHPMWTVCTER